MVPERPAAPEDVVVPGRTVVTVDLGSNSVKCLVATLVDGALVEQHRQGWITRIGGGAARTGKPDSAAVDATCAALDACRAIAARHDARLLGVATGGVRLLAHPGETLAAFRRLVPDLRLVSGEEEAHLSMLGIRAGAGWTQAPVAADCGGASTEVMWLERGEVRVVSLPIGAVVVTERHLLGDPPQVAELTRAQAAIGEALAPLREVGLGATPWVVGGTASALGMLVGGHAATQSAHGQRLELGQLQRWGSELAGLTAQERQRRHRISPGRADIVVGGALLLEGLLMALSAPACRVSAWGVRHGLAAAHWASPGARWDLGWLATLVVDQNPLARIHY